jgi:hypothetical protein
MQQLDRLLSVCALAAVLVGGAFAAKLDSHTSGPFQGPKANTGTVTLSNVNGKGVLRVSDDFKVPDTPAPTWRVVDSKGNIYTLDAFKIKGTLGTNAEKREVEVPSYVKDIVKVQVYCAWAQVLLGEASFSMAVR